MKVISSSLWTNLALSSQAAFVVAQYIFLVALSAIRIRRLVDTRIGGLEAIEIRSWPRLIVGSATCNGAFLLMHHLYLRYGPPPQSRFTFMGLHFLATLLVGVSIVPLIGLLFDGGKAIWVRTSRFKPEHSPNLIDMTRDQGRSAQLIPRGAIFSYQFLMFFTWIALYAKLF